MTRAEPLAGSALGRALAGTSIAAMFALASVVPLAVGLGLDEARVWEVTRAQMFLLLTPPVSALLLSPVNAWASAYLLGGMERRVIAPSRAALTWMFALALLLATANLLCGIGVLTNLPTPNEPTAARALFALSLIIVSLGVVGSPFLLRGLWRLRAGSR